MQITCFGELLIRLSAPGRSLLLQTPSLDVVIGGAEANVAIGLARLGHQARLVSAVPPGPLGDGVLAVVRAGGADTTAVQRLPGRNIPPTEYAHDNHRAAEACAPRWARAVPRSRAPRRSAQRCGAAPLKWAAPWPCSD